MNLGMVEEEESKAEGGAGLRPDSKLLQSIALLFVGVAGVFLLLVLVGVILYLLTHLVGL